MRTGDLLVEKGFITEEQLKDGLSKQREFNLRLGETLIKCGYISEEDIANTLSEQYNIPYMQLANLQFQQDAIDLVSQALVERHRVVPVSVNGDVLVIATSDPTDVLAIDDIKLVTQKEVRLILLTKRDIDRSIEWLYMTPEGISKRTKQSVVTVDASDDDAPLIRMVNNIIQQSVEDKASDIHFEPGDYRLTIRYRIDGQLQLLRELGADLHSPIVARIKIMSNLDISERRLPQDGTFRQMINGREVDFRVSTIPTVRGEKVVLRILDNTKTNLKLESIGMNKELIAKVRGLLRLPYGMILVTGPTGSGKTTTLYSCLDILNDPHSNIITIEDPTEYRLNGINQININNRIGLTYANILRSVLRQDPNIVMVGEIRDYETAEIAVRAALTGHLVLSTIHTNDAASALTRLTDMGVAEFLISSSVAGIMAQRLLRRVCPRCRVEQHLTRDEPLWKALEIDKYISTRDEIRYYKAGPGCTYCHKTGYSGRIGVFELLMVDETVSNMVISHKTATEIKEYAVLHQGMRTLRDNATLNVLAGITTLQELMTIAYSSDFEGLDTSR